MQVVFFICLVLYTFILLGVMWATSRKATNDTYFIGNRKSPWFVVAYGMIGASLSGVTFMSVPGDVANTQFTYFSVVLGYVLGYIVIAYLLLPLYYRLNLTSIYQFLGMRFGNKTQKTGAMLFIISRLTGSALRMYLMIFVLQFFIFDAWGIPIWATAVFMIFIIFLYTFKGGVKTVVWTDTLQTTFMLLALLITIVIIFKNMSFSFGETITILNDKGYSKIFNYDWRASNHYLKQILGGMFITIAMTGLDQDMMQKNLSCKTLKDSQRNMLSFTGILIIVNALFLLLGGLLLIYAQQTGIELAGLKSDQIYPAIVLGYMGKAMSLLFVIGLIAAGYSSADGTFTALTTSFCLDILNIDKFAKTDRQKVFIRRCVHVGMSVLFLLVIIVASNYHDDALIRIIFKVAGYTYGPILGLFAFGMFTKRKMISEWVVPAVSLAIPTTVFFIAKNSKTLLWGYEFGFELLLLNGLLTFLGLFLGSKKQSISQVPTSVSNP